MNQFKMLEMLSNSFQRLRIVTDTVYQISKTKIEIEGFVDYRYEVEKVGWDVCFTIKFDDMVIDSIINLPHENEVQFVSRIINLINNYK